MSYTPPFSVFQAESYAFPGWDMAVHPGQARARILQGTVRLEAGGNKPAGIFVEAEETPGCGKYAFVLRAQVTKHAGEVYLPFMVAVPPGCKFRFSRLANQGTTEEVLDLMSVWISS